MSTAVLPGYVNLNILFVKKKKFEDIKGVIRRPKLKMDNQYSSIKTNGHKDKQCGAQAIICKTLHINSLKTEVNSSAPGG